jgi:hypothetical protein
MSTAEPIFANWRAHHAEVWGRQPLKLQHRLADHPLFSMDALAALVDAYPRERYSLIHMGSRETRRFWQEGDIGGMKGREVIDWIAAGRMWLNLRQVGEVDARYRELLDEAYAEIAVRVPGAPMFNLSMGILISSPSAQVYYHADLPGQTLWQIHGRKRLWVYPAAAPFLTAQDLENIALFEVEVDMPYQPWYDEFATVVDLGPGEMAHWPLNAPHRVENLGVLNVSVTSEHWTDEIERRHKINLANGILRHKLGMEPRSRAIAGPAFAAKALLQGVARRTSWVKAARKARRAVEFKLDPARPGGIVALGGQAG